MADINTAPTELGTEKIGILLRKYAIPAIIAMIASSVYNMVDSIFIGQGLGALAISGLAVTFPLMNLSTAFGTLVGVGGSTILSIMLGRKNYEASNKVLSNILTLNIIIASLVAIVSLIFLDPILYFFGASENTISYAREYMQIIMYGNVFSHLYFGLNNALRATGSPRKAMGLTLFTVIFNTILDPIMIFGFNMGIKGAALATVIAQTVALVVSFTHFCDFKKTLHFERGIFKLDWRIAKDSLAIGAGPFLMNSASCIVALFINQQLRKYCGDLGVGAYGICNRVTFMFVMICMGLNQGMQPIASYNYGARQYGRVSQVYKTTVKYATMAMILGFIISVCIPKYAVMVFTHDPDLIKMASNGLRMMNLILPFVGFQIVSTNLFQCLGMVSKSVFLSLSRQLLCLVPLLYLLPLWLGENGVWWSFPVSDLIALIITAILAARLLRQFNALKDGESPEVLGGQAAKIG